MLGTTLRAKKKGKAASTGSMGLDMKENLITIQFMDMEFTFGPMGESTLVTGRIIKCTAMDNSCGLIKGNTLEVNANSTCLFNFILFYYRVWRW